MIDSIAPHRKSEAPCAAPSADSIIQDFRYRPDVDGLRAIAVLAVVFFHAGLGFRGASSEWMFSL